MPPGPSAVNEYLKSFQLGEEQAYDHYFRLYFRPLCFFARTLLKQEQDSEDLVQDCFAKLWEKHTVIKSTEAIRSFLYTTVRNACIDILRKKKVRKITHLDEPFATEDPQAAFEAALIQTEVLRQLYNYILTLPPKVSAVCQLYYIAGKNDHEISHLLHRSYHTVRNQRQKAIALLRQKLIPN